MSHSKKINGVALVYGVVRARVFADTEKDPRDVQRQPNVRDPSALSAHARPLTVLSLARQLQPNVNFVNTVGT